ncbi:hypothetical protein [Psychromonas sp. Urea-02u-13]|uniref:hypothetical protein n=1 Tax=Psychromonas sp. Urea-02u-13 TaxID=2058326 RepID=UPI000C325EDC|nr:hypothetical protein [Psychromonas sp. Urea-02u-13]PKG38731.1 hypothetical protein CXF74_12350 [Psychromonas sp. Urea-02u-13]
MDHKTEEKKLVQLEVSLEKLAILFESGLICAAEIRCLTAHSKQQVSDLCLRSCAKRISCNVYPLSIKEQNATIDEVKRYESHRQI